LHLSVVNEAPDIVPLISFPLSSLALPLNGYEATSPLVGICACKLKQKTESNEIYKKVILRYIVFKIINNW